jgi:hypothetical protein
MKKSMHQKTNYMDHDSFESKIIKILKDKFGKDHDMHLEVFNGYGFIDVVFGKNNLVIEIDGNSHLAYGHLNPRTIIRNKLYDQVYGDAWLSIPFGSSDPVQMEKEVVS